MTRIFELPRQLTQGQRIKVLERENQQLRATLDSVKSIHFFLMTYLRDKGELRNPKDQAPLKPTDTASLAQDPTTEEWVLRYVKPEEKPLVALPEGVNPT